MLDSQRMQLRISEIRSRLNEISGLEGEAFTEEVRQESDKLTQGFREAETKYRAAVVLEDEDAQKGAPVDSETAEIRSLLGRAELRNYLDAAISKGPLSGAEHELNAALIGGASIVGTPLPWALISPPQVEKRADAATALPATGVQVLEQDFVGRVFAEGSSDFLNVRFDTVPAGEASYFVLGSGLTPEHKAPGGIKDSETGSISGKILEPHRVSAAYTFRIEDIARSPNLESGLRQDLASAIREEVDRAVLNGATDGPSGLLDTLTAPDDPTVVNSTFAATIALVAGGVDGRYARNFRECRLLVGADSYGSIAGSFAANVAVSASDYILERSGGLRASDLIPSKNNSDIQSAILAKTAAGPNAVAAMRAGLSLTVRDEYTRANRGEIRIQVNGLWDFAVLRAGGFEYLKIKLA